MKPWRLAVLLGSLAMVAYFTWRCSIGILVDTPLWAAGDALMVVCWAALASWCSIPPALRRDHVTVIPAHEFDEDKVEVPVERSGVSDLVTPREACTPTDCYCGAAEAGEYCQRAVCQQCLCQPQDWCGDPSAHNSERLDNDGREAE